MTAPRPAMPLFRGLSAYPPTPADHAGRVDVEAVGRLVDRLASAGVDAIGLLGSTGIYVFLSQEERRRAVAAAVEAAGGRVPLVVGVGALRTDAAEALARDAEAAGADGLLLAPVSYTPLTADEVHAHFQAVAAASDLPVCVYNNPGTTHFTVTADLLERLAGLPTVRGVKMPLPADGDYGTELEDLRRRTDLAVGYSGDWGMADALLAGADGFHSVLAGLLPDLPLRLVRAAAAGDAAETRRLEAIAAPLFASFRRHGSLRVMYVLLDLLGLSDALPPRPVLPVGPEARAEVAAAAAPLLGRAALGDGDARG